MRIQEEVFKECAIPVTLFKGAMDDLGMEDADSCKWITENAIVNGDALEGMKCMGDESVDLIVTSPPYANRRKNTYDGAPADEYSEWFLPFSEEMQRVLKPSGSFLLNIGDIAVNGEKHPYVYELVLDLKEQGWKWIDTYLWVKSNPFPGKWKNRFKNGFEYIYHFTKSRDITWNPDSVRVPVAESTKKRVANLGENDFARRTSESGSGFGSTMSNMVGVKTALPSNVIHAATVSQNTGHSAAYPEDIPEFFIKVFSNEGDLVLDPFVGSGTTASVAKKHCRRFLGFDKEKKYADLSRSNVEGVNDDHCSI